MEPDAPTLPAPARDTAPADAPALVARLGPLVSAHNRAALAGATVGWVLGVVSFLAAALQVATSRGLAVFLFAFGVVAIGQALRLMRATIQGTGAARRAAGALLARLLEQGGDAALADATAGESEEDALSALDLLGRLGIVYATEQGGGTLHLDRARFVALELDRSR